MRKKTCSGLPPESVIFGGSKEMLRLQQDLKRAFAANLPILLKGERGVGKNLISLFIHCTFGRESGSYLQCSCPGMSSATIKSVRTALAGQSTEDGSDAQHVSETVATVFLDDKKPSPTAQAGNIQERAVLSPGGSHFRSSTAETQAAGFVPHCELSPGLLQPELWSNSEAIPHRTPGAHAQLRVAGKHSGIEEIYLALRDVWLDRASRGMPRGGTQLTPMPTQRCALCACASFVRNANDTTL